MKYRIHKFEGAGHISHKVLMDINPIHELGKVLSGFDLTAGELEHMIDCITSKGGWSYQGKVIVYIGREADQSISNKEEYYTQILEALGE